MILTTSQMLTTGVDVPTCKNIVLVRTINSMTEFKQIIGRGTRVRDDYGKLFFNILDYTGSATRLFADPDFDGDPVADNRRRNGRDRRDDWRAQQSSRSRSSRPGRGRAGARSRPYVRRRSRDRRANSTSMAAWSRLPRMWSRSSMPTGRRLQVKKFTEYTARACAACIPPPPSCAPSGATPKSAPRSSRRWKQRGISFEELAEAAKQPDADPFDLLCHVAYSAPIRSRRERAEAARIDGKAFFDRFTNGAREVLNELLEKYVEFGTAQFQIPDILKVPPISQRGNVIEIAGLFGGPEQLRDAVGNCNIALRSIRESSWQGQQHRKTEAPKSSAQQLGSIVKSCRDIMRKDKGLNGDLDRLPMLTWIMFLKFLDDMEQVREAEAKLAGKALPPQHRIALSLARLGGQARRHHRAGTDRLHQPGRSRAPRRQDVGQGCSLICVA